MLNVMRRELWGGAQSRLACSSARSRHRLGQQDQSCGQTGTTQHMIVRSAARVVRPATEALAGAPQEPVSCGRWYNGPLAAHRMASSPKRTAIKARARISGPMLLLRRPSCGVHI